MPTHRTASAPQKRLSALVILATFFVPSDVARAHHAMGGETPKTFMDSLLSGLAHPVIGIDHLVFILLMGAYVGLKHQRAALLAFIASTMAGCLLHTFGFALPLEEPLLAATMLGVGLLACINLRLSTPMTALLFAVCGVFHGYAYGEAIVGSESGVLAAYILGFSCVQSAIAWFASAIAQAYATASHERTVVGTVQALSVVSALVGIVILVG